MIHAYTSAFIAPMIVFFSLSGALQILDLHESHGDYHVPAALSAIGRFHEQQVLEAEPERGPRSRFSRDRSGQADRRRPGIPGGKGFGGSDAPVKFSVMLLKALFVLEAVALVATTVLDTWTGILHAKRARRFIALIIAGTIIPALLIVI